MAVKTPKVSLDSGLLSTLEIASDFSNLERHASDDVASRYAVATGALQWLLLEMSKSGQFTSEQQAALRLIASNTDRFIDKDKSEEA